MPRNCAALGRWVNQVFPQWEWEFACRLRPNSSNCRQRDSRADGPLIGWFSGFGRIEPVSGGINERWGDEHQDRFVGSFLRPAEQKSLAVEHGRLRAGGEPLERRLRRI